MDTRWVSPTDVAHPLEICRNHSLMTFFLEQPRTPGSWWNKNSKAQTSTGGKELCAQRTWSLRVAAWRRTSVLSKRSWVAVVKLETSLGCLGSVVLQYLIRRRIRRSTCYKLMSYLQVSIINQWPSPAQDIIDANKGKRQKVAHVHQIYVHSIHDTLRRTSGHASQ